MREHSIAIDIAAPPGRVWAVMRDVERWPEWTASMRSVRLRGPGPVAVGSRVVVRQPKLPPAWWKVVALAPERGFTWVSVAPGVRVTADHTIEPTPAGSRVTLAVRYGGILSGLLEFLTRGITLRYLKLEAEGLKRRSEAGG